MMIMLSLCGFYHPSVEAYSTAIFYFKSKTATRKPSTQAQCGSGAAIQRRNLYDDNIRDRHLNVFCRCLLADTFWFREYIITNLTKHESRMDSNRCRSASSASLSGFGGKLSFYSLL
ncbi:hypothetical protein EVAR_6782_1 [Eumeta japonica]|uniref:Uncharacterized protein n=1 Tax=Eumeta variegata TaxID=151549 RepID=A0A4C1V5Y8_EUMVA|nr:hypothetical protein EVAR_6782_1 [Eumeta japonica]